MPKRLLEKALRHANDVPTRRLVNFVLEDKRLEDEARARIFAIAAQAAEVYAGRDWRKLSDGEQKLVKMLKEAGYLSKSGRLRG